VISESIEIPPHLSFPLHSLPALNLSHDPPARRVRQALPARRSAQEIAADKKNDSRKRQPPERQPEHLIVNDEGESRISMEDYAVAVIDETENPGTPGAGSRSAAGNYSLSSE
jgi:hypothetical protein